MPKEKDEGADTTKNSKQTKARSFELEITKKKCGAEEQREEKEKRKNIKAESKCEKDEEKRERLLAIIERRACANMVNPSLRKKSLQVALVTRFPNHECEILESGEK